MERFVARDLIVIEFPFTDLSSTRKRPALILSDLEGDDLIICEITSVKRKDNYIVNLENKDLESGTLKTKSIIRPNKILSINKNRISYKMGKIKEEKFNEVLEKVKLIFKIF